MSLDDLDSNIDCVVVLYYDDLQVEIAPNEVRIRENGEVIAVFSSSDFATIIDAFNAVPNR